MGIQVIAKKLTGPLGLFSSVAAGESTGPVMVSIAFLATTKNNQKTSEFILGHSLVKPIEI